MLFLSRRFSRVRSATHSFKAKASDRRSFTSGDVAWPGRIAGQTAFPGFEELLGPAVIQALSGCRPPRRKFEYCQDTAQGHFSKAVLLNAERHHPRGRCNPCSYQEKIVLGNPPTPGKPDATLVCFWRRFCGSSAPGCNGESYPMSLANGIACSSGSADGSKRIFSIICSRHWPWMPTWSTP